MENSLMIFKEQYRQVKVTHYAVFFGIVVIMTFAILYNYFEGALKGLGDSAVITLELVLLVYAVGAVYIGDLMFIRRLKVLTARHSIQKKMELYRSALVFKLALVESIAALAGLLLIVSGIYLVLIVPVALIFILMRNNPTTSRVLSDLPLSLAEREELASLL